MTELKEEFWDNAVDVLHRRLVIHPRKGVPEDALTTAVRICAEMWTSRLAESVGDGAADAVVVALDMFTLQGRRRKKASSVGINDEGTTPTHARLNVLANVSPQCRSQNTEEDLQSNVLPTECFKWHEIGADRNQWRVICGSKMPSATKETPTSSRQDIWVELRYVTKPSLVQKLTRKLHISKRSEQKERKEIHIVRPAGLKPGGASASP
jgi:hypothetical protein